MPRSDRKARLAYSKAYYQQNRERLLSEQKVRDAERDQAEPGARAAYQQAYQATNKEVLLEKQRARSKANYAAKKAKYRARNRRQRFAQYGLTEEQYTEIIRRQEGQCPICERMLAESTTPSIDHSHVTGVVRGILCRRCNTALGLLEDSPANLERAVEYLSVRVRGEFSRWLSGVTSTPNNLP